MNKGRVVASFVLVVSADFLYAAMLSLLEDYTAFGLLPASIRLSAALAGGALIGWEGVNWYDKRWPLFGGKK